MAFNQTFPFIHLPMRDVAVRPFFFLSARVAGSKIKSTGLEFWGGVVWVSLVGFLCVFCGRYG